MCTFGGEPGIGWGASWGSISTRGVDGVDATTACCACGGGLTFAQAAEVDALLLEGVAAVEASIPEPRLLVHTEHGVENGVVFDSGSYPYDGSGSAHWLLSAWGGDAVTGGGNVIISSLCPGYTSPLDGDHLRPYGDDFESVSTGCFGEKTVASESDGQTAASTSQGHYKLDRGAATFTLIAVNGGTTPLDVSITGGIRRDFSQGIKIDEHTFTSSGARGYVKTSCKGRVYPMADAGSVSHLWVYDPAVSPDAAHTFPAEGTSDNNTFANLGPGAELVYMAYTSDRCLTPSEHEAVFFAARPLLRSLPVENKTAGEDRSDATTVTTGKKVKSKKSKGTTMHALQTSATHGHHSAVAKDVTAGTVLFFAAVLVVVVLRRARDLHLRNTRDLDMRYATPDVGDDVGPNTADAADGARGGHGGGDGVGRSHPTEFTWGEPTPTKVVWRSSPTIRTGTSTTSSPGRGLPNPAGYSTFTVGVPGGADLSLASLKKGRRDSIRSDASLD